MFLVTTIGSVQSQGQLNKEPQVSSKESKSLVSFYSQGNSATQKIEERREDIDVSSEVTDDTCNVLFDGNEDIFITKEGILNEKINKNLLIYMGFVIGVCLLFPVGVYFSVEKKWLEKNIQNIVESKITLGVLISLITYFFIYFLSINLNIIEITLPKRLIGLQKSWGPRLKFIHTSLIYIFDGYAHLVNIGILVLVFGLLSSIIAMYFFTGTISKGISLLKTIKVIWIIGVILTSIILALLSFFLLSCLLPNKDKNISGIKISSPRRG